MSIKSFINVIDESVGDSYVMAQPVGKDYGSKVYAFVNSGDANRFVALGSQFDSSNVYKAVGSPSRKPHDAYRGPRLASIHDAESFRDFLAHCDRWGFAERTYASIAENTKKMLYSSGPNSN
jgi:hypothetical protein